MKQNYIFDLYGTLVDIKTNEYKKTVWEKAAWYFSMRGANYTGTELRRRYHELVTAEEKRLWKCLQKKYDGITLREAEIQLDRVFAALYKEKGVRAGKGLIEDTMRSFRIITLEKLRLFDGAKELLQELKAAGKKVYLLSNAQTLFTAPEMQVLGITEYFDDIFFSSDLEVKKPSFHFYDALFKKHGLKKEESVMIGNDCFADAGGAENYGIDSIYLHTEQSPELTGELPEHCMRVQDLNEIRKGIMK